MSKIIFDRKVNALLLACALLGGAAVSPSSAQSAPENPQNPQMPAFLPTTNQTNLQKEPENTSA